MIIQCSRHTKQEREKDGLNVNSQYIVHDFRIVYGDRAGLMA